MRCLTTTWKTHRTASIRRLTVVLTASLALAALPGCDEDADEPSAEGIHEHLGERWQLASPDGLWTFRQAEAYCAQLVLGNRDDWRLPTIDELRTLIVDCPERQLGGACRVSEGCLDKDCWEQRFCGHCNERQGPADGCYLQPDTWEGSCTDAWFHWSASPFNGLTDHFWVVRFQGGGLFDDGVVGFNEELGDGAVRCIAGEPDTPTPPPSPDPGGISLPEFCARATEACTDVSAAQCADIIVDADKVVRPGDIPCATASSTCDDTEVCLDALPLRNVDGAYVPAQGPTTLPADADAGAG